MNFNLNHLGPLIHCVYPCIYSIVTYQRRFILDMNTVNLTFASCAIIILYRMCVADKMNTLIYLPEAFKKKSHITYIPLM